MQTKNITKLVLERVENLLLEGRLEDIKAKYPVTSWDAIDSIASKDPSTNLKYLDWMTKNIYPKTIKWFKDNANASRGWYSWTLDDVPDTAEDPRWEQNNTLRNIISSVDNTSLLNLADDIEYFHQNPTKYERKDINQYTSLKDLSDATNEAKLKLSRKEQKDTGVDKVYEDEDFLILMPKTHKASCRYGSNTRWCVTMRGYSGYYENYFTQGPIFFLVDKRKLEPTNSMDTPNYYKIAMHYRPFKGRFDNRGRQAFELAKSRTREEFINGANSDQTQIDYWNVADDKKPEKTILKFLGGPGRGQTKKGTEALTKIKNVMQEYTKKAMGEYYDSLGDVSKYSTELRTLEQQLNDLITKDNAYYYKIDRIENVISRLAAFRDRLDDEDEPEYAEWVTQQRDKAQEIYQKLRDKKDALRLNKATIENKIQKINNKISSKKLVFYDPEKNVPMTR